jgi:hypothetical protein
MFADMSTSQTTRSDWIAVLGHAAGLSWVLQHEKLAFAPERAREVRRLHSGDRVLLYAAQKAFAGQKGGGKLIAAGDATTDVEPLDEEVSIGGRTYALGAKLDIAGVAEYGEGVEVAPMVSQLEIFRPYKQPNSWPPLLRRPLLRLPQGDTDMLLRALQPLLRPRDEVLSGYVR